LRIPRCAAIRDAESITWSSAGGGGIGGQA
jgi:hypothetical protein